MKKLFKIFCGQLFASICIILFLAAPSFSQGLQDSKIRTLLGNPKLIVPEEVVEDFVQGQKTTSVIVLLHPGKDAAPLDKSSQSTGKEGGKTGTGVNAGINNRVYDLKDHRIRSQVKEVVSKTLDKAINTLDLSKVNVTRKFSYMFGFTAKVTVEGLEYLANRFDVASVEKNRILHAHLAQGIPLMNAATPRSTYNGSGIAIAICDTGIDTSHPMLGNGGSPIFNSKVIGGYDTGDSDSDPRPHATLGNAHGTACAGIAAVDIGSTGDYIGGVAPGAKLYAVKISTLNTGNATSGAMIAGWEWCITHQNDDPNNPIMIISTSFGGGRADATCDSAVPAMTMAAANAKAAGMTLFVSSGNDGYCDSMGWPACITHVNSVGAVYDSAFGTYYPCVSEYSCASKTFTESGCLPYSQYYATDDTAADMVTSYSNSASFLNLFAPSNAAYSTDIVGSGGYDSGDYYNSFGGTSAACPYAAGAAAVLQHAAKSKTGSYLAPGEVKSYLASTGDQITDGKVAITKPRVNLGDAVGALVAEVCTLINDGSFENGPPTASEWEEWTNQPWEWIVDVGSSDWAIPAFDGSYAFWAAGYYEDVSKIRHPNSNYVQQESISIPANATDLKFYAVFYRPDADDSSVDDYFYVKINDIIVYTKELIQANDTYPNWVEVSVDISAYAGQTVTLRFEGVSTGTGPLPDGDGNLTGNALVDYIRLCIPEGRPHSSPAIFLLLLDD
jgi:subtilisin family serine protease